MTAMTKLRIAILTKLSAGDMSTREIAAACDRAPDEISPSLCRAMEAGLVRCIGHAPSELRGCKPRVYSITEDGRKALAEAPNIRCEKVRAGKSTTERQRAQANGERMYQGAPCRHGHVGVRYVSNHTCVECASGAVYSRIARRAAA